MGYQHEKKTSPEPKSYLRLNDLLLLGNKQPTVEMKNDFQEMATEMDLQSY